VEHPGRQGQALELVAPGPHEPLEPTRPLGTAGVAAVCQSVITRIELGQPAARSHDHFHRLTTPMMAGLMHATSSISMPTAPPQHATRTARRSHNGIVERTNIRSQNHTHPHSTRTRYVEFSHGRKTARSLSNGCQDVSPGIEPALPP